MIGCVSGCITGCVRGVLVGVLIRCIDWVYYRDPVIISC